MCNSFDEWWNKKCASAIRVFTKQDCAKYIWEVAYAAGREAMCEEALDICHDHGDVYIAAEITRRMYV